MKDIGSDSDLYKTKVKHHQNFVEKDFKPTACKIEIAGTHILTSHGNLTSILQKISTKQSQASAMHNQNNQNPNASLQSYVFKVPSGLRNGSS